MKILQLLGNTAFGGATLIVSKIAQELRKSGFEVMIMANDEKTKEHFTSLGFFCDEIETMGRSIHPIKDPMSVLRLKRCVKENNIDVIHSHTTKGGIYSRALKMIYPNVKVVHTVHGYYLKQDNSKSDKLTIIIERLFHGFADHTTYVNSFDFNLAKNWSGKTKNHLIYNGIDYEAFSKSQSIDSKVESDVVTIGISARIVHEKGYSEFFDLIEHYVNYANVKFEIVGTGPDEEYYKSRHHDLLDRYDIDCDKVIFHGYTTDVKSILETWDINILPSYREGLSISLLEAMAMGVPSVATRIRGNVEIIEEGLSGLLYESKDSAGLIRQVERLVDNIELRKRISRESRLRVEKLFSQKVMLEAYVVLFKSL